MSPLTASATANSNIAFIKYWGNCEPKARIPANGSISMNLGGLETRTTVTFDAFLDSDDLILNSQPVGGAALGRVSEFLNRVRRLAAINHFARVESENNFPMGAGIASSASAFAALALAASTAAGLELDEFALSQLARTGSGSACRSIPSGFVEWQADGCNPDSGAVSIAPPEHWDLRDCVAIISREHKPTGSTEGHALAYTSPLQESRVAGAPTRLAQCREAILARDFATFAEITELDSNLMHAVMMTSSPRLIYWQPTTLTVMQAVQNWRQEGISVCYTIDAGPNVHVICLTSDVELVAARLRQIAGVQDVLIAYPGGPARLVLEHG
ncbi:MAG TPA: diphosphomevalonate decarboxylase [Chloroflexi bacterium]|nr:diphosphomevalonate decarboxylase [Chloroflexota bacterium]